MKQLFAYINRLRDVHPTWVKGIFVVANRIVAYNQVAYVNAIAEVLKEKPVQWLDDKLRNKPRSYVKNIQKLYQQIDEAMMEMESFHEQWLQTKKESKQLTKQLRSLDKISNFRKLEVQLEYLDDQIEEFDYEYQLLLQLEKNVKHNNMDCDKDTSNTFSKLCEFISQNDKKHALQAISKNKQNNQNKIDELKDQQQKLQNQLVTDKQNKQLQDEYYNAYLKKIKKVSDLQDKIDTQKSLISKLKKQISLLHKKDDNVHVENMNEIQQLKEYFVENMDKQLIEGWLRNLINKYVGNSFWDSQSVSTDVQETVLNDIYTFLLSYNYKHLDIHKLLESSNPIKSFLAFLSPTLFRVVNFSLREVSRENKFRNKYVNIHDVDDVVTQQLTPRDSVRLYDDVLHETWNNVKDDLNKNINKVAEFMAKTFIKKAPQSPLSGYVGDKKRLSFNKIVNMWKPIVKSIIRNIDEDVLVSKSTAKLFHAIAVAVGVNVKKKQRELGLVRDTLMIVILNYFIDSYEDYYDELLEEVGYSNDDMAQRSYQKILSKFNNMKKEYTNKIKNASIIDDYISPVEMVKTLRKKYIHKIKNSFMSVDDMEKRVDTLLNMGERENTNKEPKYTVNVVRDNLNENVRKIN